MDKSNRLDQYRGKLTAGQIACGMNHAIANAKRLISDAELLLENGKYASASGLAILAIEEYGKLGILRGLATATKDEDLRYWWKAYRTHTQKNLFLLLPPLIASGAKQLDDLMPMFSDHITPRIIDNLKQIGFYTDCLANAQWSVPTEVINVKIVEFIVSFSKSIVWKRHEVTEKEIDLWIKHIGPVLNSDWQTMKGALEDFFIEMRNSGLMKEDIDDFGSFLHKEKYWKH